MDAKVKPPAVSPERAKFVELAQKRMNRAIKAIRMIGKLDRRRNAFTVDDVKQICTALANECCLVEERLESAAEGEPDFQLGAHDGGEG